MKLLISLSYYSPHVSGLSVYAKNLAEALVQEDVQVTVLTSQHAKTLPLREQKNGVTIVRVPVTATIGKGPVMVGCLATCLSLIKMTDVVNCHLPQFESSLLAVIAKCFGKKLIVTYHTDLPTKKDFASLVITFFLLLSHYLTCSLADAIVVQTKDNAMHSSFLSHFRKKVVTIYPPIPTPAAVSEEVKIKMQRQIGEQSTYRIGFLGRMASEKGIEYLLKALPLVSEQMEKKCVLLLAGPKVVIGEHAYKEKIESLIQNEAISVVFSGSLTEEEKNVFYSLLDVFVLPSTNTTEAFGMVQVEAMYCGTPVVATDLPGVRVPIQETGMGEIVPPKNVQALAQAIVKVLQNRKNYVKEKSVIANIFSQEKIVKVYKDLFEG